MLKSGFMPRGSVARGVAAEGRGFVRPEAKPAIYIYIYTNVCVCVSLSLYTYIYIYIYIYSQSVSYLKGMFRSPQEGHPRNRKRLRA